jgi:hypothetical protein
VHGVGRAFCGHVTFRRLQALTGGGGRALLMEGVCVGGSLVEGVSLKNRVPENGMFGMSASSGRAPEAPANSLGLGATNSTYYETYSAYDAFVARSFVFLSFFPPHTVFLLEKKTKGASIGRASGTLSQFLRRTVSVITGGLMSLRGG